MPYFLMAFLFLRHVLTFYNGGIQKISLLYSQYGHAPRVNFADQNWKTATFWCYETNMTVFVWLQHCIFLTTIMWRQGCIYWQIVVTRSCVTSPIQPLPGSFSPAIFVGSPAPIWALNPEVSSRDILRGWHQKYFILLFLYYCFPTVGLKASFFLW